MAIPYPLKHIDDYGEANLDTQTLRHLRDHARRIIADNDRIRDILTTDRQREEWDINFEQENADSRAAIDRIEAELKKRGVRV